jgi:hypothetical protein
MHHYGQCQLVLDEALSLKHEEDNKYDSNAIAIMNMGGRKLAYLNRHDAYAVAKLFRVNIPLGQKVFAKAKCEAKVKSHHTGPSQKVALGFKCNKEDVDKIRDIFAFTIATLEFK